VADKVNQLSGQLLGALYPKIVWLID